MLLKKANQHYKFIRFIPSGLFLGLIIDNYLKNQPESTNLIFNHHKAQSSKHQLSISRQRNHDIFKPHFSFNFTTTDSTILLYNLLGFKSL